MPSPSPTSLPSYSPTLSELTKIWWTTTFTLVNISSTDLADSDSNLDSITAAVAACSDEVEVKDVKVKKVTDFSSRRLSSRQYVIGIKQHLLFHNEVLRVSIYL